MIRILLPVLALTFLGGCDSRSGEKHTHSFVVGELQAADQALVIRCGTTVKRTDSHPPQAIFTEDAAITQGFGYIRIDGHLHRLALQKGSTDGFHNLRSFADPASPLSVIESYDIGVTHPDTHNTGLNGDLIVTYRGVSQTFHVTGLTVSC